MEMEGKLGKMEEGSWKKRLGTPEGSNDGVIAHVFCREGVFASPVCNHIDVDAVTSLATR